MISAKQLKQFARQQRRNLTPSEAAFRDKLENASIGYKNHPIVGFYIPDFVIHTRLLIVEIDGGYHMELNQVEYDARKDAFMKKAGFHIVRIRNEDVETWPLSNLDKYPLRPESDFRTLLGRANAIKGNAMSKKGTKTGKTKKSKPSDASKNQKRALKEILKLETQLCFCLDDYKIKGEEDPCCQAHEWAREIRRVMRENHVRIR